MATKTSAGRDFQDNLLTRIMANNQIATIYLLNRMSLRGRIMRFDPYVILLEPLDGSPPQLVYKSAVVSVSGPRMVGGPRRGPGGGGYGGSRRDGPPRDDRYAGDRPYRPREGEGPGEGQGRSGFRPPRPATEA